jgi:ankyrin repeat protein
MYVSVGVMRGNVLADEHCGKEIAVARAVSTGQSDILRLLVESEPSYHREPIFFTKLFRLPDIDEGSLTPAGGNLIGTVLQAAAARGDTEMVRILLENGSNINEPPYGPGGATALQAAVESECVETVRFLLEHGADVNAPAIDPGLPRTALFTAIEIKNLDLIKVLLAFKADVCAPTLSPITEKLAAVIQAAKLRDSYSDIVEALEPAVAEAANDSSVARSKRIQLCHAIQGGDVATVRHLISLGACVDIEPVEEACWLELPGDEISSERVGASGGAARRKIKYSNARSKDIRATMLHMAITSQTIVDSSMFIYLCQQIDRPTEERWPLGLELPLHTAVRWRRFAIVEFLLKDGVNVDYICPRVAQRFESTALNLAVQANDIEMVLLLLEGGADINLGRSGYEESPLQTSLKRKGGLRQDLDFKVAKLLLSRGAIVHRPSSEDEETPLVMASENGNLDIIRMILEQGAPINYHWEYNMTPLMAAVKGGHLEAVEFLLDNGADANTPFPDDCLCSDRGTALQFAVINGSFAIAQLLLQRGANVNAVGPHSILYGRTALETAAIHGRLDIMQLCLNAGTDSHLPPKARYASALKIAKGDCFEPNLGVLKLLQEYREEALDEWNSSRILELEF